MSELKLFNKYHGNENTITNYCGLMLKLLYQSSPTNFEKCIIDLIEDDIDLTVGPLFSQQVSLEKKGKNKSIADLRIKQNEYELIFEVKTNDWFHEGQFNNYIENLSISEIKNNRILFALTDEFKESYEGFKKQSKDKGIILQLITFSQLLESLKNNKVHDEFFQRFLDDFEDFLNNEGLLNTWQDLLEVVNCAGTIKQVNEGYYICPDTGGQYSHSRAKYFGPYKQKNVASIFEIDGVVSVDRDLNATIKYNNINNEDLLKSRAINCIKEYSDESKKNKYNGEYVDFKNELVKHDLQVFLLSNKVEIEPGFQKGTPGGLFGNHIYFKGIAKGIGNSQSLADKLNGKKWEDFNL